MEQFAQQLEETRQALLQMQNAQAADQARIGELQNALGAAQGELHHLRGAAAAAAAAGPGPGPRAGAAERYEPSLVDAKGFTKVPNFSGNANQWSTFEFKFLNFAESVIPDIRTLIDWATEQPEQITLLTSREAIRLNPAAEAIQRQIYIALAQLVEGEALGILRNCTRAEFKGLEAWRRLIRRFDPHSVGRQRTILSRVLHPNRCEVKDLFRGLERWIADVQRYEERSGRRLEDDIKASVVTEMTPEPLHQHLILNQSRLNGYAAIMSEIGAFLEHRFENEANARDRSTKSEAVPMDIGTLVKGNKGKGKGKKGGSNGTTSNQYDDDKKKKTVCWTCGKTGHYALECRSGQAAGKGKGKKGAKGKGKGKGGKGPINSVDSANTSDEGWYQWEGNWYQISPSQMLRVPRVRVIKPPRTPTPRAAN